LNEKKWTPFINFKEYSPDNPQKPVVLDLQVADTELFSTLYSTNLRVYEKGIDGEWTEKILPVKGHESKNFSLLQQLEKAFHKGLISVNTHIQIKFWMEKSKTNADRMIRRFKLIILD